MITRRDLCIAALASCLSAGALALAQSGRPVMGSSVFDWNTVAAKPTKVGAVRQFFRSPTATLDELECHVTTLNPGEVPHPPHQHPDEELIIVKEGTIRAFVSGQTKTVGPGSIVFQASNQLHGLKNEGTVPATYYVIRWTSPGMGKKQ
jgi:XRE family transcriptional regulator, regulator of sulfur utilization